MPEVGSAMEGKARERRRLPTRGEQQLPSGRPVETRKLNEGEREVRRQPQHQARRSRVRQAGRPLGRESQRGPAGNGCACGPLPPP